MTINLRLYQLNILKTPFWFRFGHFHISFRKCVFFVINHRKNISKFVFENLSFEIVDAYQSVLGTCFATVAMNKSRTFHYDDVIMTMLESQITSLTVVYSIVYSGVHQRKHQSSASLAFVREIHRGPVNFPHKWPVTRKMFSFDDVIMRMPYYDCDIAVNEIDRNCGTGTGNWWFPCSFTDTFKYFFCCDCMLKFVLKVQHFSVTPHHVFTQNRTISLSQRDPKCT